MRHRVTDLFLLAQADAGDRPALAEEVELDAVAVEVTDLFRPRAQALHRQLAFGVVQPAVVRGDAMLLREAVFELLENACRHGDASAPVQISVLTPTGNLRLEVANPGPPLPGLVGEAREEGGTGEPHGLGLEILRWIVQAHGGTVEVRREQAVNVIALCFPAQPGSPITPHDLP